MELVPQVSPEEIKNREVELGLRVGLLLLQLFPNGGATDVVFVTVPHSSWDSNCVVRWSLRNAGRTLPLINIPLVWRWSTAALVFRVGACLEVYKFTLLSSFPHSSPSLIGLLASVDVKQQSLSPFQLTDFLA